MLFVQAHRAECFIFDDHLERIVIIILLLSLFLPRIVILIDSSVTPARPTIYSHQLYQETHNSSDIYKGLVVHVEKCSFL